MTATPMSQTRHPDAPMPAAKGNERPTEYADRVGEWYTATRSDDHRKRHGLYLTPVEVADFMAAGIETDVPTPRLLDPAAGAGVLCCAAVEAIAKRSRPATIELAACEADAALREPLRAVLHHLARWCEARGVTLRTHIHQGDFIATHGQALHAAGDLLATGNSAVEGQFDAVIANPPYFKIGKDDPRALAAPGIVHGQPNIYALFMAVGAALLRESGAFVYIVPRSFASGLYFRRFRAAFFDLVTPSAVHVFASRRSAFRRDDVLQENVIFCGVRRGERARGNVTISVSDGVADLHTATRRKLPLPAVLDMSSPEKVLRLPTSQNDEATLALVDAWPNRLEDLGLNTSTGPVVPFRARDVVCATGEPATHAPLLWMNHVHAMRATWPLNRHKREHIRRQDAAKLLVPARNYVLVRRLSAKEEPRRLTAAPLLANAIESPDIGLENHLNYVHRPGGSLSADECWGLAALYNSQLMDAYFRCSNGNTQVSATELRRMPLPTGKTIEALGRRVKELAEPMAGLDSLVQEMVSANGNRGFG